MIDPTTVISCGNKDYSMVHFDWFFTDWCNYSCSYCSAAVKMASSFSKQTSPAKYKMVLAKLKLVQTPFKVELLGGEPTLHPHLSEVLETLCALDNCKEVEVITNLSRSLHFFKKLNKPELHGVRILASYHPEYFTQEFIRKAVGISAMEHLEFMVNINLSDQPADWPSTLSLLAQFDENKVKYGFNFLNSTPSWTANYTDEFFALFAPYLNGREKENFEYNFADGTTRLLSESTIVEENYRNFEGYKCTPLMYNIDSDGSIKNSCTGRRLSIQMTSDELIKQETCTLNCCMCDIMYNFYKEKQ